MWLQGGEHDVHSCPCRNRGPGRGALITPATLIYAASLVPEWGCLCSCAPKWNLVTRLTWLGPYGVTETAQLARLYLALGPCIGRMGPVQVVRA